VAGQSGFRALSNEEGFIVAYPLGLFGRPEAPEAATGQGPSFNAGWCCGRAADARVNDVGFIRAVVEAVAASANIDRARVYAVGLSNGGHLSHRLACEAADVIAAIGPAAGRITISTSRCRPTRPIAVIDFPGLHDPQVPYDGGIVFLSAAQNFALWRDTNGCGSGPPDTRTDIGSSFCETYSHCSAGVQVEMCSVNASQVSYIPGHSIYLNPDIDVARSAWEFLSQFTLPAQ
jgi:polyhydroxybutyrate depolymerase